MVTSNEVSMTKTKHWNVSEIRFAPSLDRRNTGDGRRGRGRILDREVSVRRRGLLKYSGFLEPEFLREILPERFGA